MSQCVKFSITFWALWYNRNRIYHEGIRDPVQKVVGFVQAYTQELHQVHALVSTTSIPKTIIQEPPKGNIIKFNFDTSYNSQYCTSQSGVIARNWEGLVMASCTYLWENVLNSTMAEARACYQVVVFATDLGFQEIFLEGDALTIIKKLTTASNDRLIVALVVNEIIRKKRSFHVFQVKHIPREANLAAHTLAAKGKNFASLIYWMEEVPTTVGWIIDREQRDEGVVAE